jgi:hypothetical protein
MSGRAVRHAATAAAALILLAGLARAAVRPHDGFPHASHERLFPVCQSCHAGAADGRSEAMYPRAVECARCHDGARFARVGWRGPVRRPTNLRFAHAEHLARAAEQGAANCQACHAQEGGTGRMSVGRATPERCIACHEHRSGEHLASSAPCARCHLPLGAAPDVGVGRIAGFPRPAWHEATDFISTHATAAAATEASCAVCHARETCERCHANADRLDPVRELPRDERVAALEAGRLPTYPLPATHASADWQLRHGVSARAGIAACANCHTQPSCTGCHTTGAGRAAAVVGALPRVVAGRAPGIDPGRVARTVHDGDVKREHGRVAMSGRLDCAQCHERRQCTECHAAADPRTFHVPNFLERHAVDVFSGRGECQACHSTERFCRDCHARAGVAARDMRSAFHDAQPMWVLSHGQAARRGLEACASCHRQNDCVQCHSAAGGWGVNPHAAGFTGAGASRSAAGCRLCHRTSPTGRS